MVDHVRQDAVHNDGLYLAAGGAPAVPALGAVDALGVAVDSVLRLGGVQQNLERKMLLSNKCTSLHRLNPPAYTVYNP